MADGGQADLPSHRTVQYGRRLRANWEPALNSFSTVRRSHSHNLKTAEIRQIDSSALSGLMPYVVCASPMRVCVVRCRLFQGLGPAIIVMLLSDLTGPTAAPDRAQLGMPPQCL